jgi:hypothetical protein
VNFFVRGPVVGSEKLGWRFARVKKDEGGQLFTIAQTLVRSIFMIVL